MIVPVLPSPRIALFVLSLPLARTRSGTREQHAHPPNHVSICTARSAQRPSQSAGHVHHIQQSTHTACRPPFSAVRPPLKSP